MLTAVRAVRFLAVAVWLGGLIFFAAVLAPVAFSPMVIEQTHSLRVSGAIVGTALGRLHWMGLVCGAVLLLVTVLLRIRGEISERMLAIELATVAAMILMTAFSQYLIIPRMEVDRRAVGDIEDALPGNAYRDEFDRLHRRSVQVESGVMVAGLVLVVLIAAEGRRGRAGITAR